jgi:hypothetical protein
MLIGGVLIAKNRDVDRRANPNPMQRFNLLGEQIKILAKVRVPGWVFGVVVQVSVMTFCEDRHAVHVGGLHGVGEFIGIKIHAYIANERRGVEIEMDLSRAKRGNLCWHGSEI